MTQDKKIIIYTTDDVRAPRYELYIQVLSNVYKLYFMNLPLLMTNVY